MELTLQREDATAERTIGQLFIGPSLECWTLEPPPRELAPFDDHPSMPAGRYQLAITPSAHFHQMIPHVLNVPGRSDIEIHWGNTVEDTHGCVIVGMTRQHDSVQQSKMAFADLMPKLAAALAIPEEVWLTVVDPVVE